MECQCTATIINPGRYAKIKINHCPMHKAAPDLLEACKLAKKYLEPDLVEPGRTVFWKLVDAIKKAEQEK